MATGCTQVTEEYETQAENELVTTADYVINNVHMMSTLNNGKWTGPTNRHIELET